MVLPRCTLGLEMKSYSKQERVSLINIDCYVVAMRSCYKGKNYKMHVVDGDYLCILEDGNFINFVCMVLDKEHKKICCSDSRFQA